jgi:RNA polymerase sigma-70 factor, ECF subfamily
MSSELESQLRALHGSGDLPGAATLAVREYGPEILGYLYAVARDEQRASDAFAMFLEDLWRGLPAFGWRSSMRTWLYVVARNALTRQLRNQVRDRGGVPLSQVPELAAIAERTRTTTLPFLRSDARDRVHRLRELLDPDEQTLLILRVDRRMEWSEIALVLNGEETTNVARQSAALRKRFERLLVRLRAAAKQ